ncbi:MAG: hypothetical protein H6550_10970 [Chitinophagales bacterium]|nr:hypothetical protein [Chitinophagales bacterium]
MANKDSKNFVDTIVEAQKQMMDNVTEQTRKFANGNNIVKETVEKGSEWYKNWLEGQNNIYTSAKEKAADMSGKTQENTDKMTEFYQNWMNNQMEMAKQMWEMNMNHMKNSTQNTTVNNDPMAAWNNMMNSWNSWYKNMNQAAQWNDMMNKFQANNPFSADAWKKAANDWTGMFNQYYEMLNNSFSNMQKDIQNGTTQDAFRNMVNVSEAFTRFSEMWTPFMKSIQDKTFNTEMFKQYANPAMYKDLMDKYFGFMPEQSREYMQNMTNMMQENIAKMNQNGVAGYNQMRDMMGNMMPAQNDIFGTMMNNYNAFTKMMNEAAAPMTKMMGSDKNAKMVAEWNDIANRMVIYNIKNSELQYMVYTQGAKVMDNLADYITRKIENGDEINSMMTVYQDWLNIGDQTFVELFESDEYSKMMAEVNAMQLTLRKDVEKQLEKAMVGIPVATRSEMDELYKTIYELKKQVRELEKVTVNNIAEENPVKKTTTTTSSRAKKA